ncbi:MAG: ATP-binding cassette domain-containing protein [Acholeplasma sp.]|nr:ATP-binding cassette domain-containing protein [Acholeplasma sp.]
MLQLLNIGLNMEGDNGRVQVLDDINLTLEKKKIYVMTGPNGGGKSSIAKVIMGILDLCQYFGQKFRFFLNLRHP